MGKRRINLKSGIYKIENIINKKHYIGQSEDLENMRKELNLY